MIFQTYLKKKEIIFKINFFILDIFALKIQRFNHKLLKRVPKTPILYDLHTHFN